MTGIGGGITPEQSVLPDCYDIGGVRCVDWYDLLPGRWPLFDFDFCQSVILWYCAEDASGAAMVVRYIRSLRPLAQRGDGPWFTMRELRDRDAQGRLPWEIPR